MTMIDLQQNILSKCIPITETGCWIWIGATRTSGYGNIGWKGKTLGAHRASYIAFNGIIPEGLQINHKCDVRSCVNPSHYTLEHKKIIWVIWMLATEELPQARVAY